MFRFLQDYLLNTLEIAFPTCNTMNRKKLKHFNILNQLQMNKSSVVCGTCDHWLTGEIFLHTDENNYCQSCSTKEMDHRRIHAQEDFLKDLLFPCKSLDCDFILRAHQVDNHLKMCMHLPFICTFCKLVVKNDKAFIRHLRTVHRDITNAKTMSLDEPTFNIAVTGSETNEILIISFCQRVFVATIQRRETAINIEIAKIKEFPHRDEYNRFHIQYKVDNRKWTCEKQYALFSDLGTECDKDLDIKMDNNKTIDVQICLIESAYFLKLAECPICLNNLTFKVYQCLNGHNMCIDCGKKINTCAICRSGISKSTMQLDYLFPSMSMLCPSLGNGCLAVIKGDDIQAHARCCAYRTVKCPDCNHEFSKSSLISHLAKKHQLQDNYYINSYEVANLPTDATETVYLKYKDQVFSFEFNVVGKYEKKICYKVQLLDALSIAEAQKYKFEVHMGFDAFGDTKAATILRGVCQTTSNDDCSIAISYNECERYFDKYGITWGNAVMFYFRYVIIELE